MKKFVAAAKEQDAKGTEDLGAPIQVEILGREINVKRPGRGQLLFLMTSFGPDAKDLDRAGSVFSLLFSVLEDADVSFIRGKMLENEFDEDMVLEIFEYLVEEWFADPSQSSSDSVPTQ